MTKKPSTPELVYRDSEFMEGGEARPLRILSEYLQPLSKFRELGIHDTIVFFGSARQKADGPMARFYAEARELAKSVTEWSRSLGCPKERFVICTGGGGGFMEAANLGALEAGGRSIGLNIGLPREQHPNPFITPDLNFMFHYFFMRKLWFAHLARAIVIFPGGYGTLDELFEVLTLAATRKLGHDMPVILYGSDYWKEILNFPALVRHGMITEVEAGLIRYADTPAEALRILQEALPIEMEPHTPAFSSSDGGHAGGKTT
ncbi:MAG: LOG family protein [Fibrobacteria bacterium]